MNYLFMYLDKLITVLNIYGMFIIYTGFFRMVFFLSYEEGKLN